MMQYMLRRLTAAAITVVVAAALIFLLMRVVPGDPAQLMLGEIDDPELLATMRARLGLDQPLAMQFVEWTVRALRGDLGESITTGESVAVMIAERVPITAVLVFSATFIAAVVAVFAGLLAAWRRGSTYDGATVATASLLLSVPTFWTGFLVLSLLSVRFDWLPTLGFVGGPVPMGTIVAFFAMPVAVLAVNEMAVLTRMTRSTALEVLSQDYILNARARGSSTRRLLLGEVLPNVLVPLLTLLGLILGHLLGGVVVLEKVFGIPGMGRLIVDAVFQRDYPVIQGCLLVTAAAYVCINLTVDVLQMVCDPRVRPR